MLKSNCPSSSSQISEVFGKRIVDFLARNVADLKMHGTWALKVTKMAHFEDRNGIPKWKQRVSPFFGGDHFFGGWVNLWKVQSKYIWILAVVHPPYLLEYFENKLSISFNMFKSCLLSWTNKATQQKWTRPNCTCWLMIVSVTIVSKLVCFTLFRGFISVNLQGLIILIGPTFN